MDERPPSGPLDDLDERLKRLRESGGTRPPPAPTRATRGIGLGMRIGVELVAALLVGCGIGYLLDSWFGTKPWLFLVFFLLGSAAGMLNVYRLMTGKGYAAGYGQPNEDQDKKGKP
jgi:ATP synthase protein I